MVLLKSFLKKLAEKPFTWQGNVVSIAVKSIGPFEIGSECRQNYLKDNSVTIPQIVRNLTLADINTLMVENSPQMLGILYPKNKKLSASIVENG